MCTCLNGLSHGRIYFSNVPPKAHEPSRQFQSDIEIKERGEFTDNYGIKRFPGIHDSGSDWQSVLDPIKAKDGAIYLLTATATRGGTSQVSMHAWYA